MQARGLMEDVGEWDVLRSVSRETVLGEFTTDNTDRTDRFLRVHFRAVESAGRRFWDAFHVKRWCREWARIDLRGVSRETVGRVEGRETRVKGREPGRACGAFHVKRFFALDSGLLTLDSQVFHVKRWVQN